MQLLLYPHRTTDTLLKNMMISLKILCSGAHICGIWAIKYMYVIFLKHVKNETDDHLKKFFEIITPSLANPPPRGAKFNIAN